MSALCILNSGNNARVPDTSVYQSPYLYIDLPSQQKCNVTLDEVDKHTGFSEDMHLDISSIPDTDVIRISNEVGSESEHFSVQDADPSDIQMNEIQEDEVIHLYGDMDQYINLPIPCVAYKEYSCALCNKCPEKQVMPDEARLQVFVECNIWIPGDAKSLGFQELWTWNFLTPRCFANFAGWIMFHDKK